MWSILWEDDLCSGQWEIDLHRKLTFWIHYFLGSFSFCIMSTVIGSTENSIFIENQFLFYIRFSDKYLLYESIMIILGLGSWLCYFTWKPLLSRRSSQGNWPISVCCIRCMLVDKHNSQTCWSKTGWAHLNLSAKTLWTLLFCYSS